MKTKKHFNPPTNWMFVLIMSVSVCSFVSCFAGYVIGRNSVTLPQVNNAVKKEIELWYKAKETQINRNEMPVKEESTQGGL